MSIVNITQVNVLDNPTHFANPYQFEITFECIAPLAADLEWKIIYVGSANSNAHDQVLESIMVGPVPVGVNKFVFQADAPKPELIPHNDIVGVTVILITCSYQDKEFVRIGYYVNNDYLDEELRENPPEQIAYDKLYRSILAEKPRVTRFPINWENPMEEEQPPVQVEPGMDTSSKANMMEGSDWEDMEA
ncbi:histone chaperone ASF1A-like protein [Lobosporangium transversale]|uniref:Anti-silencing function protein 1 n=1 Tax=Lobosporangium transversale TaxID=64571 RepID=A0A1Y2GL94_9FUNG|nr:histone chaperone ASF1A-like protein [Lobosporangium transversale]ORZ12923.1 histone chaperone ASF1A-like protein [Lobosporangium transversale]|eukprot:XP_021880272.1 histone chaperone ASF1A-like protein [Lobosporangium transversale]